MSITNNTVEKCCNGNVGKATLLGQSQNSRGIAELMKERVWLTRGSEENVKTLHTRYAVFEFV